MKQLLCITGLLAVLLAQPAQASEITYQPVNPAFGGFAGNADWLLATAEAQRKEENTSTDPREDFASQVSRFLLSNIASNISNQILGEDAADSGIFIIDGTTIEFNNDGTNVDVTISSPTGSTTLQIPSPTF